VDRSCEPIPLVCFSKRLERDKDALLAALRMPWSNGLVEGQIHRLKLLKRQMYGRAGFDLLRETRPQQGLVASC
jgi:transposase